MILTLKQEQGLKECIERYKNGEKYCVISGYAGAGKAQPNDTIIPTPQGFKQLGDLQIGDEVYNRHGKPVKIIGVFPQGELEVFKVTLGDGRTTLCNDEHIWSTYTRQGKLVNHTLKELMQMGFRSNKTYKFKIPNMECIEYPEKIYKIDPYVIGAFLGDGCCKEPYLTLSSKTDEIPNFICQLTNFTVKKDSDKNFNWHFYLPETITITGQYRDYKRSRPQTLDFLPLELCKKAEEKTIPEEYKYGSKQQRYALLQGLLDTDGSISYSDGRYNVRFTSVSYQLILDVKSILNSLGYQSITISEDKRTQYTTGICYNLNINIPNEDKPFLFRMKRKHDLALESTKISKRKDYSKVSIYSAEDMGYKTPMTCIMVDDPEHLYVTNDYIVTHNTTLVKVIIENLPGIDPEEDVVYACYTGKAAQVLLKKGNRNVITLHKLLYESIPKPDGTFFRKPKEEIDYDVVVVDEVSMAPRVLMELLFKHDCFIICLGDPFQLPPVDKDQDNALLAHPHVFLDEIMRQALDSNIIRLSMKIRHQDRIDYGKEDDAIVMPYDKLTTGVLKWGDQILVGTNKTRININQTLRNMQGRGPEPEEGEKVICLRNYWNNLATNDDPLVNGTIGCISNLYTSYNHIPPYCGGQTIPVLYADFISDSDADFGTLNMDKHQIVTGERSLDARTIYKLNSRRSTQHLAPMEFTYAYAITTHKSQGSSWPNVVVLEEGFPFEKEEHARWLYTAVTRAEKKLVLVR